MGAGENARDVTLSHGFWIGETEVTQAMWEQLSGQPFATFMAISKKEHPEESIGPDHPAFSISWEKLRGSTARPVGLFQSLNTYLSEAGSSWKVDLPTEAQWEYACRAGGGEAPPKIDQIAWFRGNSKGTCHPVGTKDANPWGIHDMQGNLHEWCFDWFQESYEGLPTTDPVGPASGWKRVMRGGGYHSPAQSCSATSRASAYEMTAHPLIGFRLVLKPGDAPP